MAYFGRTSGTVSVGENADVNQIYFTTGGYDIQGGGGSLAWGAGATVTARSGTATISATQTTSPFSTLKVGGGAGTVVFQGTTYLNWLSQLLVDGGKLVMNGNMSGPGNGFAYLAGGSISGTGSINVALAGSGLVSPGPSGTNSGILTVPVLAPADGMDFQLVFSGTVPTFGSAGNSVNDLVRVTGGFASALTSSNSKTLFLNFTKEQLTLGTTLKGGFFTDSNTDFVSMLNNYANDNAGFAVYVLGDGNGHDNSINGQGYYNWRNEAMFGWTQSLFMTTEAQTANFGGGNVNGRIMTLVVGVPEPSTYVLAVTGAGFVGVLRWSRRRRRRPAGEPLHPGTDFARRADSGKSCVTAEKKRAAGALQGF